jgi:hypothetical protein
VSRRIPVAVIGPHDLTGRTCEVAEEFAAVEAIPYSYDHEAETESLVLASRPAVAALLFTGVVPYRIAEAARLLDRPATYISYTGASLYRALLRLVLDGIAIDRFSIDTLSRRQVREALEDAGLSTDGVQVYEYESKTTTAEIVEFHRQAAHRHGTTIAISCLRSAYEVLDTELRAVRLSPALQSIRVALETLTLESRQEQTQHAQVALGIIDLDRDDALLHRHSASLGGTVVPLGDASYLMITTRGLLEEATGAFVGLPLLAELGAGHGRAHAGFGVGRSAADAEVLARAALRRARSLGSHAAAVALNADTILDLSSSRVEVERPSLPRLARRIGMRPETLARLQELLRVHGESTITAAEVAEFFDVEQRAGRRILAKLMRAGVAARVGTRQDGGTGRPPQLYRIDL